MVSREEKTPTGEQLARIEELKGRRDRTQEQLRKAEKALFDAKESRDTLLLALYAIDHQIELLEEGQLPLFGDVDE